jgi:DNA polymerase-3 subunit beta
MAAADGFRLGVRTISMAEPMQGDPTTIIIPARALHELARSLGDQEDPVRMVIPQGRNQVLFHLNGLDLVTQLIQGNFPNYPSLIPTESSSSVVVSTAELLSAAKVAAIFARDANGIVRLEATPGEDGQPGQVLIRARAEEVGDNQGSIDAQVTGETARIAFNAKYLTDVLGVLNGEQVVLETRSHSQPGVLRAVGDEAFTHVIMPMFVQW